MMDKSREVEEENRLRDWIRHNHEEAKEISAHVKKSREIIAQADKFINWKGLRTIFGPFDIYHILHPIEEEVEVIVVQTTAEETNGSPSENTQQSI
jgi:hypothetical protein